MKQLLLIGGSAGAGKTTASRSLAKQLGAGWLQADTVWIAMQEALPHDSARYRQLRIDERITQSSDPVELLVAAHVQASRLVCAALPRVLQFELQTHETLIADGAWLLPEFLAGLRLDDVDVRCAILHEPEPAEVRAAMDSRRGMKMVAPWHERSAGASWAYGQWLAGEAARHHVPVVEARPRASLLERVSDALRVFPGVDSPAP